MADPAIIRKIGDAIQRMEGYAPGTRAYKNNNPGNIWDGTGPGKPRRIWPSIPIDASGFLVYPSYAAGRAEMERQIAMKIDRGLTLRSLITEWAPPVENNTSLYVGNVSQWTGIPPDVVLRNAGGEAPLQPPEEPASETEGERRGVSSVSSDRGSTPRVRGRG